MFEPISDEFWPMDAKGMNDGFAGKFNVYRVMAHNPALLMAWSNFRKHIVTNTVLGQKWSELVILRTGFRMDASYEISHHIVRARKCGLDDDRIAAMCGMNEIADTDDLVIARAVDELLDSGRLASDTTHELQRLITASGVLDLIATVGMYTTLAFIVKSFATPVDEDIKKSLLKEPFNQRDPPVGTENIKQCTAR